MCPWCNSCIWAGAWFSRVNCLIHLLHFHHLPINGPLDGDCYLSNTNLSNVTTTSLVMRILTGPSWPRSHSVQPVPRRGWPATKAASSQDHHWCEYTNHPHLEYILDSPSPDEGDEAEDPGLPAAHPGGGRGDGDGHPWTSSASCRCHGEEKEQGWLGFHCSSLFSHTRTSLLSPFGICQLSTCWKGLEITTAAVMQTIIIIIPCQ